jgi:competence protein ComEA
MRPIDFIRARQRLNDQIERERMPRPVRAPVVAPAPAPEPVEAVEPNPASHSSTNLNTCTREELIALSGVGPALANRIIAGRPWASIEDVAQVRGVSAAMLAAWDVAL